MARLSRHTLAHCLGCDSDIVRCGTCNNNCCNGSKGPNPGIDMSCPDCDDAYEDQTAYWKDPDCVRFAKDIRPLCGSSDRS